MSQMTPAERAKLYLKVLELYEKKEMTFREITVRMGKTYQYWHKVYVKACAWREKND